MKSGARQAWLAVFFAFAVFSPACRYSVDPDSGKFHCESDDDCGGGWHCFSSCLASGFTAYCLQDGSCEACPSLQADPQNCGTCGTACASGDECIDGVCVSTGLPDAGSDAGPDGGEDGGLVDGGHPDGSVDAGRDGGEPDGSVDAGEDGGAPDASIDAGGDGGGDAGPDAGDDAGPGDGGEDDGGLADAGDGGDSGS